MTAEFIPKVVRNSLNLYVSQKLKKTCPMLREMPTGNQRRDSRNLTSKYLAAAGPVAVDAHDTDD